MANGFVADRRKELAAAPPAFRGHKAPYARLVALTQLIEAWLSLWRSSFACRGLTCFQQKRRGLAY
jgi:hypothetical protein